MTMLSTQCGAAIAPSKSAALTECSETETASAVSGGVLRDGKVTQTLAEIAFIGAFSGQTQAAETIFRSLRLLCPGNPYVDLGFAMVCSIAGRPMDGLPLLEKMTVSPDPQQDLVPLCAGLILREAGHQAAADKKFTEAIARGGVVAEFARVLSNTPQG